MADARCTGIRLNSRWMFLNISILSQVEGLEAVPLRRVYSLKSKSYLKISHKRIQKQEKEKQHKAGLAHLRKFENQVNIDDKPQKQLHPCEATRAYSLLHVQSLQDLRNAREAPVIEGEALNLHLSKCVAERHPLISLLRHLASVPRKTR